MIILIILFREDCEYEKNISTNMWMNMDKKQ